MHLHTRTDLMIQHLYLQFTSENKIEYRTIQTERVRQTDTGTESGDVMKMFCKALYLIVPQKHSRTIVIILFFFSTHGAGRLQGDLRWLASAR